MKNPKFSSEIFDSQDRDRNQLKMNGISRITDEYKLESLKSLQRNNTADDYFQKQFDILSDSANFNTLKLNKSHKKLNNMISDPFIQKRLKLMIDVLGSIFDPSALDITDASINKSNNVCKSLFKLLNNIFESLK